MAPSSDFKLQIEWNSVETGEEKKVAKVGNKRLFLTFYYVSLTKL